VVTADDGSVADIYAVSRAVFPRNGCLLCNSLINPTKLQLEATDASQAARQHYGTGLSAPSVISLNALSAAEAVNLFQFHVTGLAVASAAGFARMRPINRALTLDIPRQEQTCPECGVGPNSRFGKGDGAALPTR
jgi:hypothetical protein